MPSSLPLSSPTNLPTSSPVHAPAAQATSPTTSRLIAAICAAVCLAPLVIGAFLTPESRGHGTHSQLGMPPCGWAVFFDAPCPTCGMTTAVSHACHLDFVGAFLAQPLGLVLALLAGVGWWACLHSAVTGSSLAMRLGSALVRPRSIWTLAVLGGGAWAYKAATWTGF